MHRIIRIPHRDQNHTVDAAPHEMPRVRAEAGATGMTCLSTREDDGFPQEGRIDMRAASTHASVLDGDHGGGEDHERDDGGRDQYAPRERNR